jgi:hypothetical protein
VLVVVVEHFMDMVVVGDMQLQHQHLMQDKHILLLLDKVEMETHHQTHFYPLHLEVAVVLMD